MNDDVRPDVDVYERFELGMSEATSRDVFQGFVSRIVLFQPRRLNVPF